MCFVPRAAPEPTHVTSPLKETNVEINGQMLKALIDTGSTQTLVQRRYVSPHAISSTKALSICCVHGDEKQYPTANVYLKVKGQIYLLNVGIADSLPYPVVLGHDLPVLLDLLHVTPGCNVAVTRAQAKQKDETIKMLQSMPFYDADIEVGVTKEHKSRKQRRREKFLHNVDSTKALPEPDTLLGYQIPGNIGELQHQDETLAECFKKLNNCRSATTDLCIENGILYQQHGAVKPHDVRDTILSLGHSIPWAGHLGKNKTLARIQRWFHWPGLQKDVTNFCKSCPQCQKTSSRYPPKAPLQPLPLISTPFERLGMDIVGPVERSKCGNRFMLVITDYATKYPEVFALKSVKAKTVAFCLVQFFSRVGFPKEILTDQGTNFMSKLLKDVYQLLGIKGLRTTPYHPQTDGLTDRFNQT
uniref:Gypsy retrotransposon integrase-like protein 1 n=1 Tax=Oryzias sinensis TaxID=183150 RepID=A0A8C7YR87_9TELE